MSYVTITRDGGFCNVCGSTLGQEEIDFECCGCCGGKGFDDEDDDERLTDEQIDEVVDFIRTSTADSHPQGGKS